MTRVLHIANTSFFINRLLSDKLFALNDCGFSSVVAAPQADALVTDFPAYSLDMARNISPYQDARSLIDCIKLIRSSRCDIVHTHSAKAGFIGRAAAYAAGVPCVHTAHGLPFYEGQRNWEHSLYRYLERTATNLCDCVLCQNHADVEALKAISARTPIYYEGNEVNFERIQSYRNRRAHARARLGLWKEDIAIGFFARIEPVKRHDVFLNAFEHMDQHAIAILAGARMDQNSEYEAYIRKIVTHSKAERRCVDLGFLSDPLSVLCACDIVALTSEKEGMPRILMEAMALGIPVCATAAPGTVELVRHEVTGLLSPVNDVQAFADNLSLLCSSREKRTRLGTNGQQYAAHELCLENVINRITRAYHLVLNQYSAR